MAKLKTLPEPSAPPPPKYALELTAEEASVLRALLGSCMSGGVTSPIFDALESGGVRADAFYVDDDRWPIAVRRSR